MISPPSRPLLPSSSSFVRFDPSPYPRIQATEFAALLNGTSLSSAGTTTMTSNPILIRRTALQLLHTLRRFVVTVRGDRHVAWYGHNDDENDGGGSNGTIGDAVRFILEEEELLDSIDDQNGKNISDDDEDDDDDDSDSDAEEEEDEDIDQVKNMETDDEIVPMKQPNHNVTQTANEEGVSTRKRTKKESKETPKKKSRKPPLLETWKEDTALYNVPFVGTNIFTSTATAVAVIHRNTTTTTTRTDMASSFSSSSMSSPVWPTGLLQSYLTASPMAVELFQNDLMALPTSSYVGTTSHSSSTTSIRHKHNIHTMLMKLSSTTTTTKINVDGLSDAIVKAYLQVLSEILTAAIPRPHQNDPSSTTALPPPPPTWLTDHILTPPYTLLSNIIRRFVQEILKQGKLSSSSTKTHSKQNTSTPVVSMATTVLVFLQRLCRISSSTARTVVRCIVEHCPISNGMVRSFVSYPTATMIHIAATTTTTILPIDTDVRTAESSVVRSTSSALPPQVSTYIAAVHWMATLMEMNDPVILNYICNNNSTSSSNTHHNKTATTKGNDPKTSAKPLGLLYVFLQRGLPTNAVDVHPTTPPTNDPSQRHCSYYQYRINTALLRFLRILRLLLLDQLHSPDSSSLSTRPGRKSSTIGTSNSSQSYHRHRMLLELFTRDCVQPLVAMAIHWAPSLLNFEQVLLPAEQYDVNDENTATAEPVNVQCDNDTRNIDEHNDNDSRKQQRTRQLVGIEARRILFLLLSDPLHSPLLRSLDQYTRNNNRSVGTNISRIESTVQLIVRTMTQLISIDSGSSTYSSTIEIQRFIIHIVTTTPILLPALLCVIPVEDDLPRKMFSTLSHLNFIATLLRRGPRVSDCFERTDIFNTEAENEHDSSNLKSNTISCAIVPVNLKKQKLIKLLHNNNTLVAYEAYKVLLIMIHRCRDYVVDLKSGDNVKVEEISKATELMQQSLPDLSVLTMGLSKLTSANTLPVAFKSNMMLLTCACEVLRSYCSVFIECNSSFKSNERLSLSIDLSKLLPNSTKKFLTLPIFMQRTILSTIRYLIETHEVRSKRIKI